MNQKMIMGLVALIALTSGFSAVNAEVFNFIDDETQKVSTSLIYDEQKGTYILSWTLLDGDNGSVRVQDLWVQAGSFVTIQDATDFQVDVTSIVRDSVTNGHCVLVKEFPENSGLASGLRMVCTN